MGPFIREISSARPSSNKEESVALGSYEEIPINGFTKLFQHMLDNLCMQAGIWVCRLPIRVCCGTRVSKGFCRFEKY